MCIFPRRCRAAITALLCGLVLWVTHGRAVASEGPPPTLNPKHYTSPSGRYALFVNPSDLYGRGKATYRLTLEGREVWSAEKPYTLWDACVGDDGVAAGYAYSHGWRGFSEAGFKDGMGDFRVVIIDPQGKERLNHATNREDSRFFHTPPNPLGAGLVMDAANDRLVVRVHDVDLNRQSESWWVYQLSTGTALKPFRPKDLMPDPGPTPYIMNVKPVKGTPLTVVHWWRYDRPRGRKLGARFTLIEPDGKQVWSLDLPDDYESGGDENADERLIASVRRSGGILGSDEPGRFDLRFAKSGQRVTYSVVRKAGGAWVVSEVARRPFVETATPAKKPAEIPLLALRAAGRIVLKGPSQAPVPEVRDVHDFVFDTQGRIAYLGWSKNNSRVLVVVDQQGKVIHTVPLASAHADGRAGWSELTCVGTGSYLLLRELPGERGKMEGAIVDVTTGKTTPIPGFTTSAVSKVAGYPDGGFVVVGGLIYFKGGATGDGSLRSFDGTGKLLGSLPGNGDPKNPAALFSTEDVTITTDGMIAAVDQIRKTLQFFDRAGKHHHTVDLKKAWGREPNYASGLSADRDGGVVVHDFHGDPPIVRMSADGTIRGQVKPRLKDGRKIDLRDAEVAPDGVLWVSDGHTLYRLLESGMVGRVLGESPESLRFDEAAGVTVDGKGRIYAVVGRTGAVHVFGPDGAWLRVCLPEAGDVSEELQLPHLSVSDSGDIYLGMGLQSRVLHYSPEGKRVAIEEAKLDEIGENWYAQPGTARRWVLGYEKVHLIDEKGAVARTITRRADGLWLEHPERASTAPDGSIAVLSRGKGRRRLDDGELAVSVYSPQAEPVFTFTLPQSIEWSFPRIAYDGKRFAITANKAIVLFDAAGKPFGQFVPAGHENAWWMPFLAPDGRGLLLFDGVRTIHRFELP